LTSWENAVGRDHPDLVLPLSNLAQAAIKAGDLPDAQAHAQRALAIAQDRLAADHPHRALAHHIAGKVALEAGRPDAALEHFLNAAEVSRAAFGSDHHNVAGAINEVGLALLALGRERAAVESFTEARRIWQAAFGDDHARVAMVSINLGEALVRLGDRSSARNALEPALEHPEFETFGDGQCSKAEFALARTLGPGDDEARRARDLAERAAARLREAQGRQHQVLEIEAWLHPRKKVPT
jgi:tetratricopeptide (TPR) repeat protein